VDVVRLEREQRPVRLFGRFESVTPIEVYGRAAGSSGDVQAPSAVCTRETSNLFGE
jgi:hypothetical protein